VSVALRVLRDDDEDRLCRMFYRLSPESVYRRFFTLYSDPPPGALHALARVDHDQRDAFVAVVDGEIVGVGRYAAVAGHPGEAEVAVVVEDAWQGRGLGRRLLDGATSLARLHGMTAVSATVQADNRPAIAMLRAAFPGALWVSNGAEYDVRVALGRFERKSA
jgi:GNAT superfamily N-acetyltransferase